MKKKKQGYAPKKKQTSPLWKFVGVFILVITTLAITGIDNSLQSKSSGPKKLSDDPREDVVEKYHRLVDKITRTNVLPGIHPVHIFREIRGEKFLHATGVRLDGDGAILTCGHAFWDIPGELKATCTYYYQVLEPYEKQFHPINRLHIIDSIDTNSIGCSMDVIGCIPGPAQLIAPLPAPAEVQGGKEDLTFEGIVRYEKPLIVRSTVTGEEVRVIGSTKLVGGPSYFVLDEITFQSQSGTSYASADNKKVYILSRTMKTTREIRQAYGLDDSHTVLTLCSSVNIGN